MIDQINSLTAEGSAKVAFKIIDSIQGMPSGYQARGMALAFMLMCERYGVNAKDVLEKTRKVTKDALSEGRGEHVRAIKDYLRKELK